MAQITSVDIIYNAQNLNKWKVHQLPAMDCVQLFHLQKLCVYVPGARMGTISDEEWIQVWVPSSIGSLLLHHQCTQGWGTPKQCTDPPKLLISVTTCKVTKCIVHQHKLMTYKSCFVWCSTYWINLRWRYSLNNVFQIVHGVQFDCINPVMWIMFCPSCS